ncbi:hypothetical protein X801_02513, partial [Opisthorchis viverrini]
DVVFKRIGETLAPSTFAKAWEVCKRLEGFEKQTPQHQLTNRRLERSAREQDTLERLLWLSNNAQIWSDLSLIFQQELTNLFTEQSEDLKNAQQRKAFKELITDQCNTYYRCEARGKSTLGKHPLNISPGTRNLQELNVLRALAEVNCLYAESLCVLLRGQRRQCHLGGKMHKLHAPWDHLDTRIDGEPGLGTAESTSFRMEKRLIENEKKLEYWKRSARISTELRDTQLFQACVVCLWNHCLPAVCAGEHDQLVATFQVSVVTKIPTSSKWHLCACTFIANNLEDLSKQTGDLNFDSGHGIPDKMPLLFTFVHEQHMWWRHCQIIPNTVFQIILDCGDSLGSKALPLDLHCELASVYAHGSIQPWMPKSDLGVLLLHKNRDASPTMKTKTPTSKGQKNVALHGRSPERPKVFMATALMERAFPKDMISHGDIDQPTYAHKPSVPQIRRVTDSDRVVELSLWMKLIRCAIFEQDYNLALQISDSAHMEHELSPTKSSRRDYYMAAFLNLRGLAVFGLFGLLKMLRSNSQRNKRSQSPSKHVTIGHVKPLVPNNEISDLFGDSIESSMFIAAEEALFNAAKFASRAKRYDLLVSCAEAYWKLCKNSELTFFASVVQMLHQCVPLKERCKQILELLVKSIAPDQRAKLNEAIRSESATPAEGDQPEVSDHFDQDLEGKTRRWTIATLRWPQALPSDKSQNNQPQQVQAEIWRSLAYESRSKQDQVIAFRSAIDALKSSDHDQMKAELLMEFAQWLMSNRMDTRNCITLLEHATDLLITTENSQGSVNPPGVQTSQVGSTRKTVKTSMRQKSRSPVREQEKTQSSASVSGDPKVLFSIGDSQDIRRLDALLRTFVLLADILQIAGQHVPENNWLSYTVLAVACVRQIWT